MIGNTAPTKTQPRRRILRATREAPAYLGMSRKVFNQLVRPHLHEIKIGIQGVGFDVNELDAWIDEQKTRQAVENSKTAEEDGRCSGRQEENSWREKQLRVSTRGKASGTSTRCSGVIDFERALARAKGRKRSNT